LAMIAYPVITQMLDLDDRATGVFLGGTIHDVAQVVGAGFSVSNETGETATLVKLIRVTMLAPVVLVFSLVIRSFAETEKPADGKRPPLIPFFVLMFLALAAINSFGLIPAALQDFLSDLSRWALLVSIAAVGMKTSLKTIFEVGGQAILLIVIDTLFIAGFILFGITYLGG
ncbi:YeiH family protein, partial [Sulfitobacter aestuarii]